MPWGYRSVSKSKARSWGTSAWNTAGETASLGNACAQYGLTEEQVMNADPPIPCQRRSCHGNSYAVVKLSDVAALKRRLAAQAEEDEKKALIEELGEEGYAKKVAEVYAKKVAEAAAAEAKRTMERAAQGLVTSLEAAMGASGLGIADTLEGMTIGKTAAKTEWYVKPDEIASLNAVDPSKKLAKYYLTDVIRVADGKKPGYSDKWEHISIRVKAFPPRQKLYARYLHDDFQTKCKAADDETIVQAAYDKVRGKIALAVEVKAATAKKAQAELNVEENRLAAFDGLVDDRKTNAGTKRSAADTAAAKANSSTVEESIENDSKKPAAKKRKVTKKAKTSDEPAASSAVAASVRLTSRRRDAVSYAEVTSEDEGEGSISV